MHTDVGFPESVSTCLWHTIRQYYGFQVTGAHLLDFVDIHLEPDKRPEDLYQRLVALVEDIFLKTNGISSWRGMSEDKLVYKVRCYCVTVRIYTFIKTLTSCLQSLCDRPETICTVQEREATAVNGGSVDECARRLRSVSRGFPAAILFGSFLAGPQVNGLLCETRVESVAP